MAEFFTTDEVRNNLTSMLTILPSLSRQQNDAGKLASHLHSVVRMTIGIAGEMDRCCQHTISQYGGMFKQIRINVSEPLEANLELATALFYLFVAELDLSFKHQVNEELTRFKSFVESNEVTLGGQPTALIERGKAALPVAILKDLLNEVGVENLRQVPPLVQSFSDRMAAWTADLEKKQKVVEQLQATLDEQRDGYNFVGLYKGFDVLSSAKKQELEDAGTMMRVLGLLMLAPVIVDAGLFLTKSEIIYLASPYAIGAFGILSFSITFLFGYFYRIFLKNSQTCKAQLLQIELRKTLCQFIQQYAVYADGLKNKELLGKFEALVFSPISYSEDSGVAMFDGFEQLTGFISAVRGKDS